MGREKIVAIHKALQEFFPVQMYVHCLVDDSQVDYYILVNKEQHTSLILGVGQLKKYNLLPNITI